MRYRRVQDGPIHTLETVCSLGAVNKCLRGSVRTEGGKKQNFGASTTMNLNCGFSGHRVNVGPLGMLESMGGWKRSVFPGWQELWHCCAWFCENSGRSGLIPLVEASAMSSAKSPSSMAHVMVPHDSVSNPYGTLMSSPGLTKLLCLFSASRGH